MKTEEIKREKRYWWAVVDGLVSHVEGFSCKPNSPQTWWCPSVQYSLTEGYHLFATKSEAVAKAIAETEKEIGALTHRLKDLKRAPASGKREDGT